MLDKLETIPNRITFIAYTALVLCGGSWLFYTLVGWFAGAWGAFAMAGPSALLAIALALFVRLALQWKTSPERIFLLMAISALTGFALLLLPDRVPDEIAHIARMFSIETPGSAMMLPASLSKSSLPANYTELFGALTSDHSWSDTMLFNLNMSSYLPHLYLVPAIAVKLCMFADVNPFVAIYVARLTNAALFAIGGYWIIKIMPMGRVFMCVYLLNPMLIQQEASCSADAVTNIVTLLFIAYLLQTKFKDGFERRDAIALAVLFVATALSKYVYVLLGFLLLLLVPKIQSKRTRTIIYAATAAAFVVGLMFVVLFASLPGYEPTLDLIRNPRELVSVLAKTLYESGPVIFMQFVGFSLSNLDILPWAPCFWAYGIVLLFSLVFNLGEKLSFKRSEKIGIIALVAFTSIAITLVFRGWSIEIDKRSDIILGVQGRYFLPFWNLALLCFSSPRASLVRKNCLLVYSAIIAFVYAVDLVTFIRAFG